MHFVRRSGPNGVADADLVDPQLQDPFDHHHDLFRIDPPRIGAFKRGADVGSNKSARSLRPKRRHDLSKDFDRLQDRFVDVLERKSVARRSEKRDPVASDLKCRLKPFQVRHQRTELSAARQLGPQIRSIAHLRNPLRRDKAGRFDFSEARLHKAPNEFDFDFGRDGDRFILEPIAGPDFEDGHASFQSI